MKEAGFPKSKISFKTAKKIAYFKGNSLILLKQVAVKELSLLTNCRLIVPTFL